MAGNKIKSMFLQLFQYNATLDYRQITHPATYEFSSPIRYKTQGKNGLRRRDKNRIESGYFAIVASKWTASAQTDANGPPTRRILVRGHHGAKGMPARRRASAQDTGPIADRQYCPTPRLRPNRATAPVGATCRSVAAEISRSPSCQSLPIRLMAAEEYIVPDNLFGRDAEALHLGIQATQRFGNSPFTGVTQQQSQNVLLRHTGSRLACCVANPTRRAARTVVNAPPYAPPVSLITCLGRDTPHRPHRCAGRGVRSSNSPEQFFSFKFRQLGQKNVKRNLPPIR